MDQIIELTKIEVQMFVAFLQIKPNMVKVLILVKRIKKPIYLLAMFGVDLIQILLNLEGPHLLFLSFDFFLLEPHPV